MSALDGGTECTSVRIDDSVLHRHRHRRGWTMRRWSAIIKTKRRTRDVLRAMVSFRQCDDGEALKGETAQCSSHQTAHA